MQVRVLGPTEVVRDGSRVDLGTRKQRAVIAALALHAGRPVPADTLIDLIWGDDAPPSVAGTLHAYVAGLRRALEPERTARTASTVLVTTAGGYALHVEDGAIDAALFERQVNELHRTLSAQRSDQAIPTVATGVAEEDLHNIEEQLTALLGWWRGAAYTELGEAPAAVAQRVRLEELRIVAVEDRALVRLSRGQDATVAAELEQLTGEHPLREGLWALRATALARAGRQADALATLRQVRSTLADELGIDPGPALQQLETAVLRQDPRLTAPRGSAAPTKQPPAARVSSTAQPATATPLVGRQRELAALKELLGRASDGTAQAAVIVGEPGIGKSRLVQSLTDEAAGSGFAVATGRCSEDEGAPPLWPWTQIFRDLHDAGVRAEPQDDEALQLLLGSAAQPPVAASNPHDASAAQFRSWDTLVRHVATASKQAPLLVVLDDLHWADASSARLLRHLVQTATDARLAVVVTRRTHPEPHGALAEAAEALARRHAVRLDLTGLDEERTAQLVASTTGRAPAAGEAAALHRRTDGNPFFLIELVRWSGGSHVPDDVPGAVNDVVTRRVARLPDATQELLRTAAVIGRSFDLALLASASDATDDGVLDDLEPALAAGVINDDVTVDSFRFAHALVRDAVYAGLSPSRRARRHAAVAAALERMRASRENLSEIARHWLAAGPGSAARAWRAAAAAAVSAATVHAHEEAATLLAAALDAAGNDPAIEPVERYGLLMARALACRAAGDNVGMMDAQAAALDSAEELGDLERLADAAMVNGMGALWTTRTYGVVENRIVTTLQRVLDELPVQDSELRCRVMLVLAAERYYIGGPRLQRALVDEGLAMARRLGDETLLAWACLTACGAIWRPASAAERLALAGEALDAAERSGDASAVVNARTMRAMTSMENGLVAEMFADIEVAVARADELRLAFPTVVLDTLHIPWLAMQGRFDEAEQVKARTLELLSTRALEPKELALGAIIPIRVWQGRVDELLAMVQDPGDAVAAVTVLLLQVRAGRLADARATYGRHGLSMEGDDWFLLFRLAVAAESSLVLGLRAEAAETYARLAPYAGRVASAGSGFALGPVDAFLALAAAAAGDVVDAARHADDALTLCAAWHTELVADWLTAYRKQFAF